MILNNKKLLALTSLLILLPIPAGLLLREKFLLVPADQMVMTIIAPPIALLLGQWLCFFAAEKLDTHNQDQNKKIKLLVLWIMPLLSNMMCGIMYALLMGCEFSPFSWMMGAFALLFAAIGNYLPKTKMNSTIGIKVSWAYSSDENWNATHRFAGKVWFFGGLAMIPGIFLPEGGAIALMIAALIILCALPVWYSYRFYCLEKAAGKDVHAGYSTVDKRIIKGSAVFLILLMIFLVAVMFTGSLEYRFDETAFTVEADWYSDLTIPYESIESVELREGNVPGSRVGGFGSPRLLMGFFKNEEFGVHTRYSYGNPEACVILKMKNQTIVLSGQTADETTRIYETLLDNID